MSELYYKVMSRSCIVCDLGKVGEKKKNHAVPTFLLSVNPRCEILLYAHVYTQKVL